MLHFFKNNFLIPIFVFFILLLDGSVMTMLSYSLGSESFQISPQFTLIVITLLAVYLMNDSNIFLVSIIIGFIYDAYYSSILGVNLFLFPMIVILTRTVIKKFPMNFYTIWLWILIVYTGYTHFIYALYYLIDIHSSSYYYFLSQNYIPSLLFNAFLGFIFIWLIQKLVIWFEK